MTTRPIALVFLLAGLTLAGCAKTFEADVARFHQISRAETETVRIVPADPNKQGSLEFAQYAGLVRAQLIDAGYRPVAENPDLLVEVDWQVSEGRERIHSSPGYYGGHHLYGHAGFGHFGHHGFHGGHFGHGFGYGYPYGYSRTYSSTVHTLRLTVNMRRPSGEVVFEGRADTLVGQPDLPAVMPYMVQAMFTDFPGESGRTQTVELKLPDEADVGY